MASSIDVVVTIPFYAAAAIVNGDANKPALAGAVIEAVRSLPWPRRQSITSLESLDETLLAPSLTTFETEDDSDYTLVPSDPSRTSTPTGSQSDTVEEYRAVVTDSANESASRSSETGSSRADTPRPTHSPIVRIDRDEQRKRHLYRLTPMSPEAALADLQREVVSLARIPPEQQRLCYRDKIIDADKTVAAIFHEPGTSWVDHTRPEIRVRKLEGLCFPNSNLDFWVRSDMRERTGVLSGAFDNIGPYSVHARYDTSVEELFEEAVKHCEIMRGEHRLEVDGIIVWRGCPHETCHVFDGSVAIGTLISSEATVWLKRDAHYY